MKLPNFKNKWTSSLLPSNSLGEQFANSFLQEKSKAAVAPSTINLNSLAANLPQHSSSSSLAGTWSNEYATMQPQKSLSNQWVSQYSSTSRSPMESAWGNALREPISHDHSLSNSSMWSAEFLSNIDSDIKQSEIEQNLNEWQSEFLNEQNDTWRNMENEWESIQKGIEMAQGGVDVPWHDVYNPEENNPFTSETHPVTLGDTFSNAGDVGNAVLAYEAAVQQNPNDAQAWCKLGLANAENEEDGKAIDAFRKSLNIEPSNKEALLGISVSLANESMENDALKYLALWLAVYEGNPVQHIIDSKQQYYSFLDGAHFEKVEQQFLAAARQQRGEPDAALQNALGVLYNINKNYARAIECIRIAVQCSPEDPRLWNRLGATLANSQNSVEAIAAYRQALVLHPSFVRARYNLAISCMQLQSYKEAAEHLVSALELQKNSNSSRIWSALRSAVIRFPIWERDVLDALEQRNLEDFKNALSKVTF
ncbi:unnamed protein product [Auanema sp. JU1783]|nr:unnamed protein product [Auanema sp. JU1783]